VVLADRSAKIGQALGGAQPVIERALTALGVELKPEVAGCRTAAAKRRKNSAARRRPNSVWFRFPAVD
jgi:hypothetical protein